MQQRFLCRTAPRVFDTWFFYTNKAMVFLPATISFKIQKGSFKPGITIAQDTVLNQKFQTSESNQVKILTIIKLILIHYLAPKTFQLLYLRSKKNVLEGWDDQCYLLINM